MFNKNMLARINKDLGGEFDLASFDHHAFYNEVRGRIEMHLVSSKEQNVRIKHAGAFHFMPGESIHTENSYKYTMGQIEKMAQESGFEVCRHFTDEKQWFDLALLAPSQKRT